MFAIRDVERVLYLVSLRAQGLGGGVPPAVARVANDAVRALAQVDRLLGRVVLVQLLQGVYVLRA